MEPGGGGEDWEVTRRVQNDVVFSGTMGAGRNHEISLTKKGVVHARREKKRAEMIST